MVKLLLVLPVSVEGTIWIPTVALSIQHPANGLGKAEKDGPSDKAPVPMWET